MAVRRLAEHQPESFAFTPENRAWADRQIARFPPGRQASAVIALLWRAQEQEGWVTRAAIENVAEILAMPMIRVLEVATFYTMFHLEPVGRKAHIQVCGTTPCMLRGSDGIIAACRRRIHAEQHHLSSDGDFSWEEVECLGACVNAPMVQVGSDTFEDLTPETFDALLDTFARGERPPPGPQNGRRFSMPAGGATTLTEIAYSPDDVRPATRPFAGVAPRGAAPAGTTPARLATGAGKDPTGPETHAQEIGRVDSAGRADEAAARAAGSGKSPRSHAPKDPPATTGGPRSAEDRAAEPRSDRDSPKGGREGR